MPFFYFIGADQLSMGDKWGTSGITTLIGLGMTFVILAVLIGMILLMRLILKEADLLLPKLKQKIKLKRAKDKPAYVSDDIAPSDTEEETIDDETMDAIKAAVLNYVKTDDNVVIIKSVTKADGKAEEAVAEETAPVAATSATQSSSSQGQAVKAPMPGNIIKIVATEGKQVKEGDVIFVLEAMKMENDIVSSANGKFHAIVAEGAKVNTGDQIAEIQ